MAGCLSKSGNCPECLSRGCFFGTTLEGEFACGAELAQFSGSSWTSLLTPGNEDLCPPPPPTTTPPSPAMEIPWIVFVAPIMSVCGVLGAVGFLLWKKRRAISTWFGGAARCSAPPGLDAKRIFEPFATNGRTGAECYTAESLKSRPFQLCSQTLYVWGFGGQPYFLPEHVGYPLTPENDEYVMLEVHYDNPQHLQGVQFETGVEIFYTPNLRQYDAGMMTVGHTVLASLLIPPKSKDYMIVGHCGLECTNKAVPPEGINIFNTMLHTHLAGRKMKLRHFRDGAELPWISYDDHYHFDYQKNRPLREERKIRPGDQMTFECTYDTMNKDHITVAGYSTRNEMCETFVWYYPKGDFEGCSSLYPIEELFRFFGIQNVQWLPGIDAGAQPVITAPSHMANKTFSEALESTVTWTPELRSTLQNMVKDSNHLGVCNIRKHNPPTSPIFIPATATANPPPMIWNYPKVDKVYKPPEQCRYEDNAILWK